jgi:Predicted Zn-dependent protease (DUF2268)
MALSVVFLETDEYAFARAERMAIEEVAGLAVEDTRRLLVGLPLCLTATVFPSCRVVPGWGSTGYTPAKDWIQISINPWDPRGVLEIAGRELRSLVAHETHHAARWALVAPEGLLQHVTSTAVFEGLATVFQREMTGLTPPWGEYDEDVVDEWVAELLSLPPGIDTRPWRFRHGDGRQWIAYEAGTRIVERACAELGSTAAELVGATTRNIIKAAGWEPPELV